jgi:hypothetical protein
MGEDSGLSRVDPQGDRQRFQELVTTEDGTGSYEREVATRSDTFHFPLLLRSPFQDGCRLRTNG